MLQSDVLTALISFKSLIAAREPGIFSTVLSVRRSSEVQILKEQKISQLINWKAND